jgi:guanylate kinase
MEKGLLIILSGPSGVGKGTIRQEVMKDASLNLFYSVSMTTRPQRAGEVEGREYYFVNDAEFQRNIDNGNLLEHADFVGHRYGTPKNKVEAMREQGKNVILEIEVNGASQVLSQYPQDEIVSIFLMPPSLEALEARIRGRCTEGEAVIEARLAKARKEVALRKHYKYVVINDDVHRASNEICSILHDEIAHKASH